MWAVKRDAVGMVATLLGHGSNPHAGSPLGLTSWMVAACAIRPPLQSPRSAILTLLLDHLVGVDLSVMPSATPPRSMIPPLMLAARLGLVEAIRLLADRGADLDAVDSYGRAALAYAAVWG